MKKLVFIGFLAFFMGACTDNTPPKPDCIYPIMSKPQNKWIGRYSYTLDGSGAKGSDQSQYYNLEIKDWHDIKMEGTGFQLAANVEFSSEELDTATLLLHYKMIKEGMGLGFSPDQWEQINSGTLQVQDTLTLSNGKLYWHSLYRNGGKVELSKVAMKTSN